MLGHVLNTINRTQVIGDVSFLSGSCGALPVAVYVSSLPDLTEWTWSGHVLASYHP